MRDFLRKRGVYVKKGRGFPFAETLVEVKEEKQEWPDGDKQIPASRKHEPDNHLIPASLHYQDNYQNGCENRSRNNDVRSRRKSDENEDYGRSVGTNKDYDSSPGTGFDSKGFYSCKNNIAIYRSHTTSISTATTVFRWTNLIVDCAYLSKGVTKLASLTNRSSRRLQ